MKRIENIASLFERHARKTGKKASMPEPDVQGTADVVEEQTEEFVVEKQTQETVVSMSNVTVEQTRKLVEQKHSFLWTSQLSSVLRSGVRSVSSRSPGPGRRRRSPTRLRAGPVICCWICRGPGATPPASSLG